MMTLHPSELASRLRSLLLLAACATPLACYNGIEGDAADGDGPTAGDGADDGVDDGADDGVDDDGADDGADDGIPEGECVQDAPAGAPVRRLTNAEYANTIMDVLGVDVSATVAEVMPIEVRSDGFSNTSAALLVTYDRVEGYRDLAKVIPAQMPNLAGDLAAITDCTDFTEACERPVIEHYGLRLWRRPLDTAEVDSFLPIFTAVLEESGTFEEGAGLVIEAMLQTPQFIYRLEDEWPEGGEPGDLRALNSYELASRLSYLVLGSAPDDALYAAAADDSIKDEAEIEAQVRRMLELPRARETSLRYVEDWLALEGVPTINRDPAQYPNFTSALAEDMREESLALADEILWEQRLPISALLTADFTIVSPELATFYGFPNVQADVARYELSDVEHRLGLLTHAGVLAINGHGNRPSIVERGLFVLGGLMCREVAAPPADLDTTMADLPDTASERQRSDARLQNTTCNNCHSQFDSMGYGFEPFDGVGAFQLQDPEGNDLRQDGWYFDKLDEDPIPYDTVEELVSGLSEVDAVIECISVRKPMQFAAGRPMGPGDVCALEEVGETIAAGDGSYQELIVALAKHPTFRVIRAGEGE